MEYRNDGKINNRARRELGENIRNLEEEMSAKIETNCKTGLYTLKFHLFYRLGEELKSVRILEILDTTPFEGYNAREKCAYNSTARLWASEMMERFR